MQDGFMVGWASISRWLITMKNCNFSIIALFLGVLYGVEDGGVWKAMLKVYVISATSYGDIFT